MAHPTNGRCPRSAHDRMLAARRLLNPGQLPIIYLTGGMKRHAFNTDSPQRCRSHRSVSGWSVAYAQQGGDTSQKESEDADQLQEIMVTAERRSVDIMTTPIQMTAIPASQLERVQPNTSLEDLQSVVPSFTVSGTAGTFQNINIRGVGNTSTNPAITTGVAVIRDGLPDVETNALGQPYYDLRGIEVLRGPQGTFVGANSTGGALLINSADPSLAGLQGSIEAIVGTYTDRRFSGVVNMPVNDQLAFRLAYNAEAAREFLPEHRFAESHASRRTAQRSRSGQ